MLASNEIDPEGWEVPVHLSLTKPILLAGVPREAAILMGTFGAAIGLYVTLWVAPGVLLAWVAMAVWAKHDQDGLKVLKRFWRQQRYYYG